MFPQGSALFILFVECHDVLLFNLNGICLGVKTERSMKVSSNIISYTVSFNNLGGIPSGPTALLQV